MKRVLTPLIILQVPDADRGSPRYMENSMASKIMKYLIILLLIPMIFVITTCNPLNNFLIETTRVTVNTGLNPAESRTAAADVISFKISISADDMSAIEYEFTEESISIEVEAGPNRRFVLEALDADGNVLFSGNSTINLTAGEDAELVINLGYAGFYVTFNTNGGTSLPVQYVQKGGLVSIPVNPVRTDFSISGWYTDSLLTQEWILASDVVNSDLTLYAAWADAVPPVPGGSGILSISSITDSSFTVSWSAATDTTTSQSNLNYEVYISTANNITSLTDCILNGTKLNGSNLTNISSYNAGSLISNTSYYINILVSDEDGNKAVYISNNATTASPALSDLFFDDFSTDGSLDGLTPDVGGVWSVSSGTFIVSNGIIDTSLTATDKYAYADLSSSLASGETLVLTFTTEELGSGTFANTSWAGISLYSGGSSGTEHFFIGNIGSLSGWGIGGDPGSALLSPAVTAAAQTVIFTYEYDTGFWTLNAGGSTGSGTVTSAIALDCIRIGAESSLGGNISISTIKAGADSSVYVATTGNDTTGDGSSVLPYATIQKGIDEAVIAARDTVKVASGTYVIDSASTITLADGVSLFGGYESSEWTRDVAVNTTTISQGSTSTTIYAFTGSSLSTGLTIDGFTIESINSSGSAYGLYLTNCQNLTVSSNNIVVKGSNSTGVGVALYSASDGFILKNNVIEMQTGPRYVYAVYASSFTGTASILNNLFNLRFNPVNGGSCGIHLASCTNPVFIVRNNTFIIGEDGNASPSYAFGETSANTGTVTISFDNNIVYEYYETFDGGSYGLCRTTSVWDVVSLKNNNFFQLDSFYYGNSGSENYISAADLNSSITGASSNVSVDLVDGSNTYFVDETADWHLTSSADITVREGAIDGSSNGWSFTDDIDGTLRTGNGSTGWSIGAYEQD